MNCTTIGLLRKLAGVPAQIILSTSDLYTEFRGAMTENYVLNELVKSAADTLYYWSSGNMAEVDFVLQQGAEIIPIEVKSEKSVKSRSLAEYREDPILHKYGKALLRGGGKEGILKWMNSPEAARLFQKS